MGKAAAVPFPVAVSRPAVGEPVPAHPVGTAVRATDVAAANGASAYVENIRVDAHLTMTAVNTPTDAPVHAGWREPGRCNAVATVEVWASSMESSGWWWQSGVGPLARSDGGGYGRVGQPANQVKVGRLLGYCCCTALWDLAYGILLLLGAVMISGYSVVTGSATV